MKLFKDSAGRDWPIVINVGSIERVKSVTGVNLLEVVEGKLVEKLASDPALLVNVVYSLCKPDADRQQITDTMFGEAMVGDAIDRATDALLDELVSFFPNRQRQILTKALAKARMIQDQATTIALQRLDDPAIDAKLQKMLSESFGTLPDSAA